MTAGAPSPIPGVAWGRATRHIDARGGLAEIARASAIDLAPVRTGLPGARWSRRTSPRRPPASCAASTSTGASSTAGTSHPDARSWRSWTSGRSSSTRRPPDRRDP